MIKTDFRLHELCSNSTEKVMYNMDTMPRVFSLSAGDLTKHHIPFLYCHVDLYLPSKAYGVNVYIEVGICGCAKLFYCLSIVFP